MLDNRKESLLRYIIEDYIETAQPVGSKQLAERHGLDVSSATIRNEMASLEMEGFLRHPHTSAGRIPTEKAYLYYLQNLLQPRKPEVFQKEFPTQEFTLKTLAKRLVEVTGETAIIASGPEAIYAIGVSHLLQKPDFSEIEDLHSISALIDQFDEVMAGLYAQVKEETIVYIGSQNPFGSDMTTILVRYRMGDDHEGVLGLVGPLRMNYAKNIALVERAKELITQLYET